jgi:hypothetical protein
MHMIHTLLAPAHVRHSYAFCGQSPYVTTFHANPTELDGCTAPEKKCSRLHLSARLSGLQDSSLFLSQHNHWSSALKSHICWRIGYISLLGPHHQHVISTFNTCSRGVNTSVLNQHRPELQPWRCRLAISHFPPFPIDGPPLFTNGLHPVSG